MLTQASTYLNHIFQRNKSFYTSDHHVLHKNWPPKLTQKSIFTLNLFSLSA